MAENGQLLPNQLHVENDDLHHYLDDIADEEIPKLVRNKEKFRRICEHLIRVIEPLEKREAAFERLLQIVRRLSLRCDDLQYLIDAWEPRRQALVQSIEEQTKVLNIVTKTCNGGRLTTTIIDTVGLIGGLVAGESNDRFANIAFSTGKICRIIGFSASALELFKRKSVLEDLIRLMQEDREAFEPIEAFFLQNNELEEAIRKLIPFEISSRVVTNFMSRTMQEDLSQIELLQAVLGPLLLEDARRLRDVNFIRNLVAFTMCPAAKDWCRWIILRHHQVSLDIETLLLQMVTPQRFVGNTSVGLTALEDRPSTLSILSRIGLNLVNICDAVNSLTSKGMVHELEQLRKRLSMEMQTVVQISRLLSLRRA